MRTRKKVGLFIIIGILALVGTWLMQDEDAGHAAEEITTAVKPEADSSPTGLRQWIARGCDGLSTGVELARERGARMRELIRTNPEQAIREALTISEWMALPAEIQAHVEQPFSVLANVNVMISCGENFSETIISTEFPTAGKMETFVYGRRGEMGSKVGIPVQGIRVGDIGALREEIFQPLEASDEAAALQLYPVAIPDPGGDSIAALAGGRLFYFKSRIALEEANKRLAALEELPGPDTGAQALFNPLEAYILPDGGIDFQALEAEASAAATAWTGTPRDMYVIMVDFPDLTGQPADPAAFSNVLNTTVSQQFWEMSYEKTHIVATVNPKLYHLASPSTNFSSNAEPLHAEATALAVADGIDLSSYETVCVIFPYTSSLGFAGLADISGSRMWLNGSTNKDVVIHELGHNYGSSHASSWVASGSNPADPAGSRLEYGDFTDIMGGGDAPEGHFNAWHKKKIGWFETNNWYFATNSGIYRVYRSDHRQTTGLVRGLAVAKGGGDEYWLGLRQEYAAYDTFSRGAYLLWKQTGTSRSHLLDTSPQSAEGGYDGGLALGQTYSDTSAGVHITPTARGGQTPNEWMDITVNLGSFSGNTAPTASLSGPASLGVQESALFTVTASDADGDELAYSWDIGDGLVKPNSSAIPAVWLTGGTATVSCVVSDMKGGTNRVSQAVSVSSPLDNWTLRPAGTSLDLEDVAVGSGRLVVVCEDETTIYSDDGIIWTSHTSFDVPAGNIFLEGITYNGSRFIAVGMDYDWSFPGWEQTIYTSPDGTYWTERYDSNSGSGSNIRLNDAAFGNGYYVAVGDNGTIVRSTDAISWSSVSSGTSINLGGVSYGDGTFVAVGSALGGAPATVLTSSDGLSWADYSSGVDLESWKGLEDVEYFNDRFLAGGWYARIMHSMDQGQTFTTSMAGNDLIIPAFAYGDGVFFAAGVEKVYSGTWMTFDINHISLDGENWTVLATPDQDDRNAAIFYNGTFITVGDNGAIWQSDALGVSGDGYATWQLANESALGFDRDPLDDADFDGHLNLEEYAMGTSATDAGSGPASGQGAVAGGYFQVSYERDGIAPDINYSVERASSLVSNDWNAANTVVIEDVSTNLTARSIFPMATQTNEFMRLELELK